MIPKSPQARKTLALGVLLGVIAGVLLPAALNPVTQVQQLLLKLKAGAS